MGYTEVGYQVIDQHASPASTVTVDLSSLIGGVIAAGDVAYVMPFNYHTTAVSHDYSLAGWVSVGGFGRSPIPVVTGEILERTLTGTETTVTFTDAHNRLDTQGAFVVVYRGLTAAGAAYNAQQDATGAAGNPADVTGTVGSTANGLGATRQILLYVYLDMFATGSIVRTFTDPALQERIAYTDISVKFFLAWFDEPWESVSNLPSRSVSSHWSAGTATHYSDLMRMWSPTDQDIPGEAGTGGDAWAWVG